MTDTQLLALFAGLLLGVVVGVPLGKIAAYTERPRWLFRIVDRWL